MNLKKIIKEEIDDFDWIRDVGSGIQLEPRVEYFIDACETGFDEKTLKMKMEQLFGDKRKEVDYYVNWFNNRFISSPRTDHKCYLVLHFGEDFVSGEWTRCEDMGEGVLDTGITISVNQFINSYL